MTDRTFARAALLAPLVVSAIALSGCMGSPTYGTDKTAAAQLFDDVSGAATITPKRRDPIDYKPRPELVKPAPGQKEACRRRSRASRRRAPSGPDRPRRVAPASAPTLPRTRTIRITSRKRSRTYKPIRRR
ncbi:hypothetical protein ACVDG8_003125 [Mesorhizobium sp. ORM8.1]